MKNIMIILTMLMAMTAFGCGELDDIESNLKDFNDAFDNATDNSTDDSYYDETDQEDHTGEQENDDAEEDYAEESNYNTECDEYGWRYDKTGTYVECDDADSECEGYEWDPDAYAWYDAQTGLYDFDCDPYDGSSGETGELYDTTGGIVFSPNSKKGTNRYFIGTYVADEWASTCADEAWGPGLDIPYVLRAYSYEDIIDFETSLSQLVWTAIIYPDYTFDFRIKYKDYLGKPSLTLTCTCGFNEMYYNSGMVCACDASNYGACDMYYSPIFSQPLEPYDY